MPPKGHIVSPEDQAKILVLAVHLDNGHDFVITNMIHKSCRYSYTVGLTRHKIPEILVAGLKQQTAMELLTDIGTHHILTTMHGGSLRSLYPLV